MDCKCSVACIEFLSSEGDSIGMVLGTVPGAALGHSTLYAVVAAVVNIRDLVPCLSPAQPSPAQPTPAQAQHRGSRMTNEMEISGAAPRQFSDSTIRLLSDMEMRCRDEQLQR